MTKCNLKYEMTKTEQKTNRKLAVLEITPVLPIAG